MIFLVYNCVQNFKDHYVKALNLFKRVVFTKALTKNLTTKNSDAKSIIDEILSMQSLLKRSRIDIIKANKKFDLFISLDCANEERYGRAVEIKKLRSVHT